MNYRAHPAVNWSTLKWMRESPLAYHHRLHNPPPDTEALAIGRAVHTLVFEPAQFADEYAVWDGGTRRGKAWDEFCADNADRTILRDEDVAECEAIADAVRKHSLVQRYIDAAGEFEIPLFWTDPATGLECKARPDWIIDSERTLIDLKTTRSINARRFGAEAARFGYHCQLAHYRAGLQVSREWESARCLIIAVEKTAPYDVAVFEMPFDALEAGKDEIDGLLQTLKVCRESGHWPGCYETEQVLQLPAYIHWEMEFEYE